VKYGTKERGFPHPRTGAIRWKYTFADVVYITDETSTQEITSWVLELPLSEKAIPIRLQQKIEEAKRRVTRDPGIITSHTVIVVDKSASMKKSDMDGHKRRDRGVYYNLAEEFCAPQLNSLECESIGGNLLTYTDVVTLIEMRDGPTVIFEHEPITWLLYNKFVRLSQDLTAKSHGNYYPSMLLAFDKLEKNVDSKCALSLFFLTDGKPSDEATSRLKDFPQNILYLVLSKSVQFNSRLTFAVVGYGMDNARFSLLEEMADLANRCGAKGIFLQTSLDPGALGLALSSVISSTTEIRSQLSRLTNFVGDSTRKLQKGIKVCYNPSSTFNPREWKFYYKSADVLDSEDYSTCERYDLVYEQKQDRNRRRRFDPVWKRITYQHPEAVGIAKKEAYFGEGAERIVYEMTEINSRRQPVGEPLVAKESRYVEEKNAGLSETFHKVFIRTQKQAEKYAKKFNQKLNDAQLSPTIPRISFLPCYVYYSYECEVLAEKRLNVANYKKWNDNAGGVDGIARQQCVMFEDISMKAPKSDVHALGGIKEESEQGSDADDDDEDLEAKLGEPVRPKDSIVAALELQILENDIPKHSLIILMCLPKETKWCVICKVSSAFLVLFHSLFLLIHAFMSLMTTSATLSNSRNMGGPTKEVKACVSFLKPTSATQFAKF